MFGSIRGFFPFHWAESITESKIQEPQLCRASLCVMGAGAFCFTLEGPLMFVVHYATQLLLFLHLGWK
ncbi:hypothetical protein L6164_037433 [Bauhinia variegata]|uniref:Uncharacterized protein n=1 Tax=Bauhinia variegata TaxID=167791 RepID=A0ACB9KK11_BAUVA|nr:hypothetical protein L6164_037433 [Bauhinia variegata]